MSECVLVGVPDSGKSTYLAALRHLLVQAPAQAALRIQRLGENDEHLNGLEAAWAECEALERTKSATEAWVTMHTVSSAGEALTVQLPDLRGEAFEDPACHDACDLRLSQAAIRADSILLLTTANQQADHLMDDLNDLMDEAEAAEEHERSEQVFDPKDMAEQAKLVEFLQFLNRRPAHPKRRRLAVLVSAWDLVADQSPEDWFVEHRPMLSQFFSAKAGLWNVRVYGLSAQGGPLAQQKVAAKNVRRSYERMKIVGHGAASHDLSAPLYWLSQVKE